MKEEVHFIWTVKKKKSDPKKKKSNPDEAGTNSNKGKKIEVKVAFIGKDM